jgi:hypothetical protein
MINLAYSISHRTVSKQIYRCLFGRTPFSPRLGPTQILIALCSRWLYAEQDLRVAFVAKPGRLRRSETELAQQQSKYDSRCSAQYKIGSLRGARPGDHLAMSRRNR